MGHGHDEVSAPEVTDRRTGSQETVARLHEWVFLTANRGAIAAVILVAFLVVLALVELQLGGPRRNWCRCSTCRAPSSAATSRCSPSSSPSASSSSRGS